MTSFTHSHFPATHRGVTRLFNAVFAAQRLRERFRGARGIVALLLAGVFSAFVVLANQIVSRWAEGQVVIGWITLWPVLFGAACLFAEASRGWSDTLARFVDGKSKAREQRLEDERTWQFAQSDPRFMAELQVARFRAEEEALAAGRNPPAWPFGHMPMGKNLRPFM